MVRGERLNCSVMMDDDRKLHEECGVFGIYAKNDDVIPAYACYNGLLALQHRGQESCGIVVNDRGVFAHHKDLGLVPEVFQAEDMEKLGHGNISIGHVRYSTTGKPNRANAQPIVVRHVKGSMSIAHNGNLTNSRELQSACSATSRPVNMHPSGHTWHTQQLLQSKNAVTAAL